MFLISFRYENIFRYAYVTMTRKSINRRALNAGVDCVHAVWGEPETEADATYRAGKPEQLEEIFL